MTQVSPEVLGHNKSDFESVFHFGLVVQCSKHVQILRLKILSAEVILE